MSRSSARAETRKPLFDSRRLAAALVQAQADVLVAHSARNYLYLSSFASLDYVIEPEAMNFVVAYRDGSLPLTATVPRSELMALLTEPTSAERVLLTGSFYVHNFAGFGLPAASSSREGLRLALADVPAGARMAVELELLPADTYLWLREQLPKIELIDGSELLRELRQIKTAEEIERIKVAATATDAAIGAAIPNVAAGMSEHEVAGLIAAELVARGVEPVYVQIATGAAAGLCGPTHRIVQTGDVIRADVAATFRGYHSDLGRGFAVGEPSPRATELYRAARAALEAAIEVVAAGASAADVFHAGLEAWHRAGHNAVQRHHVGHGVGLQAHESPMLTAGSKALLEDGMVLAIEVPYYVYGEGGFAPEDMVVVTDSGCERLTYAPAELPIAASG
jgi:Xaa-Pro aminopeptidase